MKKLTLIFLAFVSLLSVGYSQNTQNEKPTLYVSGSAQISVKPDLGILNISVSEIKMKMSDAIKSLSEKSNYYNDLLKKMGYNEKDIKTTSFSVYKNKVYRNNEYVDSGFVASQIIRLEFVYNQQVLQKIVNDFSKSDKPIDFSFDFTISEELKKKTQNQLIENGVNDANSKAQIIANASKMKIKSIKSIAYGNAGIDSNINLADPRQKMVAYANSNYESQAFNFTPNDIIFQDNVTMEFILE